MRAKKLQSRQHCVTSTHYKARQATGRLKEIKYKLIQGRAAYTTQPNLSWELLKLDAVLVPEKSHF